MLIALGFWDIAMWIGIAIGVFLVFYIIQMVHFSMVMAWGDAETRGLGYYGKPPAERAQFKAKLRRHGIMLYPILRILAKTSNFTFDKAMFSVKGVAGPTGTCTAESFERAMDYQPTAQDVFVATQMKCGTTWMQHLVYEVLMRGQGDLVEQGQTLYSVSPWIEANKSVPMDESPLIGTERPSRIVKTHLPTSVMPYSESAKYIYVVRHPVSCFASCVDFVKTNIGAFAPALPVVEEWFKSPDQMWWGTWPAHVEGWWQWSKQKSNVLFVTFEDMKADLGAIAVQVADFLGMKPLTDEELGEVTRKCGFRYMQQHGEAFEMHPPHILATDAELFVSGKADRHLDVPQEARDRIATWVREEMAGAEFPLEQIYPS